MITLPEHLEQPFKRLADHKHESVDKLLEQLVEEYLEDYYDVLIAEKTLAQIESGEVKVLSLSDAWAMLDDLDN